jgi:hypothetical protein
MKKWTESEIQFALTYSKNYSPFYIRSHFVVTNVFWGAGFDHELDLLSVSKSGYGTEVEIKVSVSDLKRDADKKHGHTSSRIKDLYFAGPVEMQDAFLQYTPENAGVITVEKREGRLGSHIFYQCRIIRKPKSNIGAAKFTEKEIVNLLRLGNMRFWTLLGKEFYYSNKQNIQEGKNND